MTVLRTYAQAIRWSHWAKNTLIAWPAIASQQVTTLAIWPLLGLGWLAWGCIASALYLVNDLWDYQADRQHPHKCRRPLAAGTITWKEAEGLILGLLLLATAICWTLPKPFVGFLALYALTTWIYGRWVKEIAILDILTLAILYVLRIFAGGVLTHTPLSPWFIVFILLFFLGIALTKRCAELQRHQGRSTQTIPRRGYIPTDLPGLQSAALTSHISAVVVFGLYLTSQEVSRLWRAPGWMWVIIPILLYWILRLHLRVQRGHLTEDPVTDATTDPQTYLCLALTALILWSAS